MIKDDKFRRSESNPGALVSTDRDGLIAYKKKKQAAARINKVESDVAELKAMMALLLEKLNK